MNDRKNENGFISFHLGCDLGKENDFTAICFLRKFTPLDRRSRVNGQSVYEVLMMKRFALKTSYVSIVSEISNRLKRSPFDGWQDFNGVRHPSKIPTYLTFDKTGTGAAVAELLKNDRFLDSRLEDLRAVNITAGREVNETSDALNIPKRDLIMATLIAFERGFIEFAADIPELPILIDELQNFEMRFTSKGNDTYSAKGTNHDDMVIALSLTIWSAKNTDESFDEDLPLKKAILWSGKSSPSRF
jgi:hypothetical protein